MTSDFVKQVHLETARRYQQQGHDIDYLVSHFQKVAFEKDEIAELLNEISAKGPSATRKTNSPA